MDECVAHLIQSGRAGDAQVATAWRGELRLWVGQYVPALADLDTAATAEQAYALGWHGAANLLLGNPERALASLDKAATVASWDVEVFTWRGELHECLGEWERARADFDRAVRMTGMPVWPLVGRALVKAQTGDGEGAIADFLALPRRITAFFQWQTGTRVERDPERAVRVLRHMRDAARGLRRAERYLDPLWMRRASPPPSSG
jgi:tetratricopeptide (TPR) repeat protein